MINKISLIAIIMVVLLFSCIKRNEKSILDEISGVWRAKTDGSLISIIYLNNKINFLIGNDNIAVTLGDIDKINKTVNFNITLKDSGKPGVWTIRQIWDNEHKSFHLELTMHDGTQDELTFVRKISNDDLNKIASSESRNRPGSISEAVKPVENANTVKQEETAPAQAAAPSPAPIPTTSGGSTVNVPPNQTPSGTITQQPQQDTDKNVNNWTPSFDCAKVSSGPERLICSNKVLSTLDVKMAQVYKEALSSAGDKESLKKNQSTWRKNT